MPITAQHLTGTIRFTIWGPPCQRIHAWEHAVDQRVFDQQLETGLFRGHPLDEHILTIMHRIKEEGGIAPYYGAGGGGGACAYSFRATDAGYAVGVENGETDDTLTLTPVEEASTGPENDEPAMVFTIDGPEYRTLRQWPHWSNEDALTSRYVYQFGRVSLGRLGYTVKVEDTLTGEHIDATDYEDW